MIVSESLVIAERFGPWGGENTTLLRNVKNGVSWRRLPCIFHRIETGTLSVWSLLGDVDGMFSLVGWGTGLTTVPSYGVREGGMTIMK
jgi:hypothetical protein